MKFGIALPNFGKYAEKKFLTDISQAAEDMGFASLWVSDHVVIPNSHEGFGDEVYDPLITLSYISAVTNEIKLGTSVLILPYRNPIVLAKMISTLDNLSGGRLIVGLGAGWLEDEFRALRVDYSARGAMTDDYIGILKTLWTEDKPRHKSDYFNFSDIKFLPKPIQTPHPPIWIGGGSRRAIKRAVTSGDGWHPVGMTPEALQEKLAYLYEVLERGNKSGEEFTISLRRSLEITDKKNIPVDDTLRGSQDKIIEGLSKYKSAGVNHIIFQILSGSFEGVLKTMEIFSRDIKPSLIDK